MADDYEWRSGKPWEWPESWADWKDGVNTVASVMINLLDVAVQALNLAKAFVPSYVDPITAIVQALVAEIEAYIRDLQQSGAYAVGDWSAIYLSYPYQNLRGGYNEYEKRMVARLTDWKDPNRPDVSPKTRVLALFFYVDADLTTIQELRRNLQAFQQLLNLKPSVGDTLPRAFNPRVAYGSEGMTVFSYGPIFSGLSWNKPPAVANITWEVTKPLPSDSLITQFAQNFTPPVDGFLIEVSTVPNGIALKVDRPDLTAKETKLDSTGKEIKPRETLDIVESGNGNSIVLWGGGDQLSIDSSVQYTSSFGTGGSTKEGCVRVYGQVSDSDPGKKIIPLEKLKEWDADKKEWKYRLQRTFMLGQLASYFSPGASYTYSLPLEDLPIDADFNFDSSNNLTIQDNGRPKTYYARVRACSDLVENSADSPSEETFAYKYDLVDAFLSEGVPWVPMVQNGEKQAQPGDAGAPSEALVLTFPDQVTQQYLEAVESAILALILSRSDYNTLDDLVQADKVDESSIPKIDAGQYPDVKSYPRTARTPTGLEGFGDLTTTVLGTNYESRFVDTKHSVTSFRLYLIRKAREVALNLYGLMGRPMPALEKRIVDSTPNLREATFGVDDIKRNLREWAYATDDERGIAANVYQAFGSSASSNKLSKEITEYQTTLLYHTAAPSKVPNYNNALPMELVTPEKEAELTETSADSPTVWIQEVVNGQDKFVPYESTNIADKTYEFPCISSTPVLYTQKEPGYAVSMRTMMSQEMYDEARMVLNLIAAGYKRQGSKEWYAFRFFPQLPNFMDFMKTIENWLKAISDSIKAVGDALTAYINFIQARVVELQLLIRKINQLLVSIQLMEIPTGNILVTLSEGTDGILSDFQNADNKPYDSTSAFGGGCLLVLPLAPIPATDLLLDLLEKET
jgi:hypothetical protein